MLFIVSYKIVPCYWMINLSMLRVAYDTCTCVENFEKDTQKIAAIISEN